jgi:hypothetical protein
MSSRTEISEVVFGQHVHLSLMLVILFFWVCLKDKFYNSNPQTEELKGNIRSEIVNIPAEQFPPVRVMSTCIGTSFSTPPVICERR